MLLLLVAIPFFQVSQRTLRIQKADTWFSFLLESKIQFPAYELA